MTPLPLPGGIIGVRGGWRAPSVHDSRPRIGRRNRLREAEDVIASWPAASCAHRCRQSLNKHAPLSPASLGFFYPRTPQNIIQPLSHRRVCQGSRPTDNSWARNSPLRAWTPTSRPAKAAWDRVSGEGSPQLPWLYMSRCGLSYNGLGLGLRLTGLGHCRIRDERNAGCDDIPSIGRHRFRNVDHVCSCQPSSWHICLLGDCAIIKY